MNATDRCCGNCRWWFSQAPAPAAAMCDPALPPSVGACQAAPPVLARLSFGVASYFPTTHESRVCAIWEESEEDDGGGGEEVVVPFERKVA